MLKNVSIIEHNTSHQHAFKCDVIQDRLADVIERTVLEEKGRCSRTYAAVSSAVGW